MDLQSVGVKVLETDLTPVTSPVSSSIGAYVGHFNWGPVDEPINVSSELILGQIFGTPSKSDDANAASFLTAESFLKYGNSLKVVRCVDDSARNAIAVSGSGIPSDPELIKNKTHFETTLDSRYGSTLYARCPGELGNSLGVLVIHKDNLTALVASGSDATIADESGKFFTVLPETTEWAQFVSEIEYTNDEIHIIVYDKNGAFTGVKDSVLETWQGLSLNPNARSISGANNFWADVINEGSAYLFATGEVGQLATGETTYHLIGTGSYSFSSGDNGVREAQNVIDSLPLLIDSDNVDLNLLFAESFIDDTAGAVADELIQVVAKRKDCLGFVSAPLSIYTLTTQAQKLTAVKNAKNAISATNTVLSYIAFDSTPVYVYNKYSDKYIWIPACGHMAGLCAYTDEVSEPWFSPAGYNRGQLRGVTKIAYQPTLQERDELYNTNINPIVSTPGQGIILFGDKTGQTRPSAFDRINVRRLFITLQRVISQAAKYQLFELNDEFTRSTFINAVEPYLEDVQGRRGIIDFKVVCDESNNTPQVIDSNRFVADIYIKPARSINYISLNFIATRTGLQFSEIITNAA